VGSTQSRIDTEADFLALECRVGWSNLPDSEVFTLESLLHRSCAPNTVTHWYLGLRAIAGSWQNSSGLWPLAFLFQLNMNNLNFIYLVDTKNNILNPSECCACLTNFTPLFNPKIYTGPSECCTSLKNFTPSFNPKIYPRPSECCGCLQISGLCPIQRYILDPRSAAPA
jgi:hypothetical protein